MPIRVEDAPPAKLVRDGVNPRGLVLLAGTPVHKRPNRARQSASPAEVGLYLRNLEISFRSARDFSPDRSALLQGLRESLLQEIRYFFDIEDE